MVLGECDSAETREGAHTFKLLKSRESSRVGVFHHLREKSDITLIHQV